MILFDSSCFTSMILYWLHWLTLSFLNISAPPTVTVRPVLPFEGPSESFVKVYVGGVPEGTTTTPTLQGCIRGLVVSGEGWDLGEEAQGEEGISTTCGDHCQPHNPCMHGGTCKEMWDSFECNCTMTSYTGKTCQEGKLFFIIWL